MRTVARLLLVTIIIDLSLAVKLLVLRSSLARETAHVTSLWCPRSPALPRPSVTRSAVVRGWWRWRAMSWICSARRGSAQFQVAKKEEHYQQNQVQFYQQNQVQLQDQDQDQLQDQDQGQCLQQDQDLELPHFLSQDQDQERNQCQSQEQDQEQECPPCHLQERACPVHANVPAQMEELIVAVTATVQSGLP